VQNLVDLDRLFAQIDQEKGEFDIVLANAFAMTARSGLESEFSVSTL
jgi:hypothetical protein